MHVAIPGSNSARQAERKTNLKYALFFFAVAVLLIVARQLGKNASTTSGQSTSMPNVQFDLSIQRTSEEVVPEGHQSKSDEYVVWFRLSNRGNHVVFYPVRSGTNVPEGRVVYRTSAESEWMALPSSKSEVSDATKPVDENPAWIEMPPGGWVDGQFNDSDWPRGEHAYAVDLKLEPSAKAMRFISPPYHFKAN